MRHDINVRVYYEDTDFTGVVYHANYLRFFERGRSDALRAAGLSHKHLLERDVQLAFTIRTINIVYYQPARIDDLLRVETVLTHAKGARMVFRQFLHKDDTTLAEGTVEVALMDLDGRPKRLPADILAACTPTVLD